MNMYVVHTNTVGRARHSSHGREMAYAFDVSAQLIKMKELIEYMRHDHIVSYG